MCEYVDRLINKGYEIGRAEAFAKAFAIGYEQGQTMILSLMRQLFAAGRIADAQRAANDSAYRDRLLAEFGLA